MPVVLRSWHVVYYRHCLTLFVSEGIICMMRLSAASDFLISTVVPQSVGVRRGWIRA
jgi:hypothetical protein